MSPLTIKEAGFLVFEQPTNRWFYHQDYKNNHVASFLDLRYFASGRVLSSRLCQDKEVGFWELITLTNPQLIQAVNVQKGKKIPTNTFRWVYEY